MFLAYPVRQGRGAAAGSIRDLDFLEGLKSCMCRPQSKMFARPHIRAETARDDLKYPTSLFAAIQREPNEAPNWDCV